jgi:hypothetical protein
VTWFFFRMLDVWRHPEHADEKPKEKWICMVYVDELVVWAHAKHRFKRGSCHLTADSEEELHALAQKIGLRREWFQAR